MNRSTWGQHAAAVAALATLAACGSAPDERCTGAACNGATPTTDAELVADVIASYRAGRLLPANEVPFPSAVAAGLFVRVWATKRALGAYLDPKEGGAIAMDPGDALVRELLDLSGQTPRLVKLTMIAKQAQGYSPSFADLLFAATTPDGAILDDGGEPQIGRLSSCEGCHETRAPEGFLFGPPS